MYREFRNTFIFGEPGTGKSKFLRYYIEEVVDDKTDDSEIIMLSHKPLGYHSPRILVQATNGFEETIQDVYARYNARLQDENVKSLPKLYFFLDGLRKTYAKISDDAKAKLGEMMKKGPKANLYCVMTSSTKDFNEDILSGSTVIELK